MDRYIPNHIPFSERLWNIGLSLFILAWGAFGIWSDDLIIPTKRHVIHLHGAAAVIMFGAMIFAALNLLSVVADHYDLRNNEITYRRIAFGTQAAGWILFIAAFCVHFFKART